MATKTAIYSVHRHWHLAIDSVTNDAVAMTPAAATDVDDDDDITRVCCSAAICQPL